MAEPDAKQEGGSCLIRCLLDNIYLVVGLVVVFLVLKWKWKDIRHRYFAALMEWFTKDVNIKMQEMKKDLFVTLDSIKSHDPALRKSGGLKILEIGVGTGTNFAHYPNGTRLTVVDPNPHFKKYYDANRKKFPNVQAEDIIVTTGEEMDMVPSNSMDVVVVTLVFCSVSDIQKVLNHILRVLVPGGKFYFYEHIMEFDDKQHYLRKMMQNILTKINFWPFFFDNCHLNRNILKAVKGTGFADVKANQAYAPIDHPIFQLAKPSLTGIAVK